MNDKVITRKDEIRYTTSDPKKMLGRFLSCNVVKKWIEDFVDKSGQVQSVERNELLFEKRNIHQSGYPRTNTLLYASR